MNTRIKNLRKQLGLTQSEFGEKIGLKGNTITNYENNIRTPSDAVIYSICREFNVNEQWLRSGEGDMFLRLSRNDEIAAYVARVMKDENAYYQQKMLLFFSRLSPEMLKKLEEVAKDILSEQKKEQKD